MLYCKAFSVNINHTGDPSLSCCRVASTLGRGWGCSFCLGGGVEGKSAFQFLNFKFYLQMVSFTLLIFFVLKTNMLKYIRCFGPNKSGEKPGTLKRYTL